MLDTLIGFFEGYFGGEFSVLKPLKTQFLIGFHCKINEILDEAIVFSHTTLNRVDPYQCFDHQKITN